MPASTRIDLHLHSSDSDGKLSPQALADLAARRGITLGALADHDTLLSQKAFQAALARRGVSSISAVELTTFHRGTETHLLGYGVDVENRELLCTLAMLRQQRDAGVHSIRNTLHHRPRETSSSTPLLNGQLESAAAIALIHRAGGKAFLAHPASGAQSIDAMERTIVELKAAGLDGIEAIYSRYPENKQRALRALAESHGLLISGGSDFHDPATDIDLVGVDMPAELWVPLRQGLGERLKAGALAAQQSRRSARRRFLWHIVVPTALAMLLFVVAIFGFILPQFERSLVERKREMIRELASSAVSILEQLHRAEQAGELTRPQAQRLAAARIQSLRYGREGKDYFWLQDLTPRIIMHPYRPELNGQDVSELRDPRGARLFVEFADVVRRHGEGYVDYVWQWKDDPTRLAPKESFVKGFEPWGWVVGTGLYMDDVRAEIARLERGLILGSLAIGLAVAALLFYVVRESMHLERQRQDAEHHLLETTQRYQSLVEASTEGALLVTGGRCVYANPWLLRLLGYSATQVPLLHIEEILPPSPASAPIDEALRTNAAVEPTEAELCRSDQQRIACTISVAPIQLGQQNASILLVRETAGRARASVATAADFAQLVAEIAGAADARRVATLANSVAAVAARHLDLGMHPHLVARELSGVCDATAVRLMELAMGSLPPAPAPFCLVGMGSHGRQEQTLFTDQDNAIIFADDGDPEVMRQWCVQLGTEVCRGMDEAGYGYCRGEVMARNPRWCHPLSAWKQMFRQWIARAEPQELLELSICFDLRAISGPAALVEELRRDTFAALVDAPAFLPHLARQALQFKPPLRLFGRILSGTAGGEHAGFIDLKDAMMPIVSFARLYALKHAVPVSNTLQRLQELAARELLAKTTCDDLAFAYQYLLKLRLEHQVQRIAASLPADNAIDHRSLGHIPTVLLREAFGQIDVIQRKITREFLGGQA